jgi:hypothetical protein
VNRRIPAALGIVLVIAAVRELQALVPTVAMLMNAFAFDGLLSLLLGTAAIQLAAGIVIAIGSRHARLLVFVWTVVELASAIYTRNFLSEQMTPPGWVTVYVEMLAGPAIAWFAVVFFGEEPVPPQIPRARLVSGSSANEPAPVAIDRTARRFDIGVALLAIGLLWILGNVLGGVVRWRMFLHYGDGLSLLLGDAIFVAHAIVVGMLAIRASRRLLSPTADARSTRRAVGAFVIVELAGTVGRYALMIGYQLLGNNEYASDILDRLLLQWSLGAALSLVLPGLLWWYAKSAIVDSPEPIVPPPPVRLAYVPAFAVALFAPYLLVRLVVAQFVDPSVLSSNVLTAIGIVCTFQGVVHVVAVVAMTRAIAGSGATVERSVRAARVAAIVGTVLATLLLVAWVITAVLAVDPATSTSMQVPVFTIVQLVVATATMSWTLGRPR